MKPTRYGGVVRLVNGIHMRSRAPLALLGAAAVAFGILFAAAPASAMPAANPVVITPGIQEQITTSSFTAEWEAAAPIVGTPIYEWEISTSSTVDADGAFVSVVEFGTSNDVTALVPAMPDGIYYFHVRAGDDEGLRDFNDANNIRVFLIDTTAPVITITSPLPVSGASYPLTFDVDEFTPFEWWVEVDGVEVASGTKDVFDTPTSLAADIDLTGLANGTHALTVYATDMPGWTGSASTEFTINRLPATGFDERPAMIAGLCLLTLGFVLFVVRRVKPSA